MNSIFTVFAVLTVVANSCYLIKDPWCCHGVEYVNDCFAESANETLKDCQHNACGLMGGVKDVIYNSTEWYDVNEYVTMLDTKINEKLLESGVRFNYGCWDHQRLKQAKMQLVNGKNYWVKLQLLCDPLRYYGHIYFYMPINMDSEGHIEFPNPQLMAIQYPHFADDPLDVFKTDDISVDNTSV